MRVTDIAIIGAGPYGLSLAAHIQPLGVDLRIFGDPMSLWRSHMPEGMRLKSEGFASSLYDPNGEFTLAQYCSENGIEYADVGLPVALDTFANYGLAFQKRFVPDVENRVVSDIHRRPGAFELHFADGDVAFARRVVVAIGVGHFAHIPDVLAGLPSDLVSHSSHHHKLDRFIGRDIAVIGAGASAIDIAALLHSVGANVTLIARTSQLAFQKPPGEVGRPRPWRERLRWPSSGIGNGWKSTLCAEMPLAFSRLPESMRLNIVRSHLGPAPCWFTKEQIIGRVSVRLGASLARVQSEGDRVRLILSDRSGAEDELLVDHVVAGTGFRPDLRRLAFLHEEMRREIASIAHTPVLSSNFESSIEGMYFVGPITANTFGPLTRFAYGAGFATERLTRHFRTSHSTRQQSAVAAAG